MKTTQKSYVKGYGEVWFDEQTITIILALKNVKSKFRFTYNRNNEGSFTLHKSIRKEFNFNMHKDVLQYHETKNHHITLVQNVRKNEAGYIKRQLKSEKLSREIYIPKLGIPPIRISRT